jgi:hypothetical protein
MGRAVAPVFFYLICRFGDIQERLPKGPVTATRRVAWLRIAVEGGVVVVSILLAFAIDTWWTKQQALDDEQEVLLGLHRDFEDSREGLDRVIAFHDGAQLQFARFLSSTPDELAELAPDSLDGFANALFTAFTYEPVSSTLDAAGSDGRLSLVQNPDLPRLLATWSTGLEDLTENEQDVRSQSMRARIGSERHGGPFYHPALTEETLSFLPRVDGVTLRALRSDSEFVAITRNLHLSIAFYLRQLRPLGTTIDSTLVLIEGSLR